MDDLRMNAGEGHFWSTKVKHLPRSLFLLSEISPNFKYENLKFCFVMPKPEFMPRMRIFDSIFGVYYVVANSKILTNPGLVKCASEVAHQGIPPDTA